MPTGLQQCLDKATKLDTISIDPWRIEILSYLQVRFEQERRREHAMFGTNPHQLCRVTFYRGKVNTMRLHPWPKLVMGCYFRAVAIRYESFA